MSKLKKILISPYSKTMRNGKENPKNYPYWKSLVKRLTKKGYYVAQIGTPTEPIIKGVHEDFQHFNLIQLIDLIKEVDTFISVDNFFQHMCHYYGLPGIVLWGKSDPNLFGYPENINLLKSRKYLRADQFNIWEAETFNANAFVKPGVVAKSIETILDR